MLNIYFLDIISVLTAVAGILFLIFKHGNGTTRLFRLLLIGFYTNAGLYSGYMFLQWAGISYRLENIEDLSGAILPLLWIIIFYMLVEHVRSGKLKENLERIQQINIELEGAKKKAEESDALKTSFLANLSHEIRTPMNGILGFAELLRNDDLSVSSQRKYLEVIRQSGQRLLSLIEDLVDISKIEANMIEIKKEKVNLNKLMKNIFYLFKPLAQTKGLDLSLNNSLPDPETFIITDHTKLEQILSNLLNNAVKYTTRGGIIFGLEPKDRFIYFYVKDTGVGIPPEKHSIIFKRFRQADSTYMREEEGSGLGLAISKAYVVKMGGSIGVESEAGKGSVFWFTLPDDKTDENNERKYIPEELTFKRKEGTILIAEDDDSSCFYLDVILKKTGMNIIHAKDGKEAIALFRNNPGIILIIMDMKMPVMNGLDATTEIRKTDPRVPIIAQTAYTTNEDRQKFINAGCNEVISKPVNRNELLSKIKNLLNKE